jgi:hypothetical protein
VNPADVTPAAARRANRLDQPQCRVQSMAESFEIGRSSTDPAEANIAAETRDVGLAPLQRFLCVVVD